MSLLYSSESPSPVSLCLNGTSTDCSPCVWNNLSSLPASFSGTIPVSEDPRIEFLRLYSYGVALPSICLLGIIGNIFNLIVLTRRNMRGTAYIYMRGDSENSQNSEPVSEDEAEINCPLVDLVTPQKESPTNGLLALLDKKSSLDVEGPEVHTDISDLLSLLLTKGLDNEGRKLAIEKYPLKGCTALKPPEINAEIKPCLTSAALRQDTFLVKLQSQLAAVLSGLAVSLNNTYESIKNNPTEVNQQELEKIGDPLKLIADIFYIVPLLDSSIKDVLETCPVDSLLFGNNFPEKLKLSKEAKKFGASIKKKATLTRTVPPMKSLPGYSSSSNQAAGTSARRSNYFLGSRRPIVKTRYKKEEEGRRSQKRPYQH